MSVANTYSRFTSAHQRQLVARNDMPTSACDQRPDVDRVGQRVNGRYLPNGYHDRRDKYTDRAFRVLGV